MSQFLEYLKMAVANIRANKMRSLLTMLGNYHRNFIGNINYVCRKRSKKYYYG